MLCAATYGVAWGSSNSFSSRIIRQAAIRVALTAIVLASICSHSLLPHIAFRKFTERLRLLFLLSFASGAIRVFSFIFTEIALPVWIRVFASILTILVILGDPTPAVTLLAVVSSYINFRPGVRWGGTTTAVWVIHSSSSIHINFDFLFGFFSV